MRRAVFFGSARHPLSPFFPPVRALRQAVPGRPSTRTGWCSPFAPSHSRQRALRPRHPQGSQCRRCRGSFSHPMPEPPAACPGGSRATRRARPDCLEHSAARTSWHLCRPAVPWWQPTLSANHPGNIHHGQSSERAGSLPRGTQTRAGRSGACSDVWNNAAAAKLPLAHSRRFTGV